MEIKIENYLSDDEIKEIVKEELREEIKSSIKRNGATRFISNMGYGNVLEIINEEIPNYEQEIKEQVKKVIDNLSSFSVFRKADLIEREDSLGQKYLEEAVSNNKELINNKVIEIIEELDKQDIADEICSMLEDKVYNLFKGGKQ